MEGKQQYKLLIGTHMDGEGTIYLANVKDRDLLYLTEDKAARMGSRVVLVEEGKKEVTDKVESPNPIPDPTATIPRDWAFIRERRAVEVIDIIKALDTRDDLLAVRAEEGKGETPRTGVLKAIQARLSQLEGEGKEE